MTDHDHPEPEPVEEDLGNEAFESLGRWRELWSQGDTGRPETIHVGLKRWVVLAIKWLARPFIRLYIRFVRGPQRTFNLSTVDHLESLHLDLRKTLQGLRQVRDDLRRDVKDHERRISHMEAYHREGMADLMRYSDALYARIDQKLDRYQRDVSMLEGEASDAEPKSEKEAGVPAETETGKRTPDREPDLPEG